ncbi:TPA: hypothetical protein ACGOWL_001580, partial [Streptococcus suis]
NGLPHVLSWKWELPAGSFLYIRIGCFNREIGKLATWVASLSPYQRPGDLFRLEIGKEKVFRGFFFVLHPDGLF